MEANGIKQNFPQDFQDLPDNDLIGYFFGSRQGDLKNFRISAKKVADSLGIISLGGAPIYFEGNQLPSLNNSDDPVKKGDWVNLTAGQTYLNINGGSDIQAPIGRWSIGAFDGDKWVLKDMGSLSNSFKIPNWEDKIYNSEDVVVDDSGVIFRVKKSVASTSEKPTILSDRWEIVTTLSALKANLYDQFGYVEKGNGSIINAVDLKVSPFLKIKDINNITVSGYSGRDDAAALVAFYDKNRVFLGSYNHTNQGWVNKVKIPLSSIPSGSYYIRNTIPLAQDPYLDGVDVLLRPSFWQSYVDDVIADLKLNINSLSSRNQQDYFNISGYVEKGNGSIINDSTLKASIFLKLDKTQNITVSGYSGRDDAAALVAFYDKDFNFISSLNAPTQGIVENYVVDKSLYPSNSVYVRFTRSASQSVRLSGGVVKYMTDLDVQNLVLNSIAKIKYIDSQSGYFSLIGYINKNNGFKNIQSDFVNTRFLKIIKTQNITVSGYSGRDDAAALVAFYDKDFNFISSLNAPTQGIVENYVVDKSLYPSNSVYVRSSSTAAHANRKVTGVDISANFNDSVIYSDTLSNRIESLKRDITLPFNDTVRIKNYLGNYQNIHPKVLHFPSGLWGYKYWMGYTPFPNEFDQYENPCIAVSNDGIEWSVPVGHTNPLATPPPGGGYNSDTHLVYRDDTKTLEIWYRPVSSTGVATLVRRTTQNGFTWTSAETISGISGVLSPSVIFEDGKYKIWYPNASKTIYYTESSGGTPSGWSAPVGKSINIFAWHMDFIKTDLGTEFLIQGWEDGQGDNFSSSMFYLLEDGSNRPAVKILSLENLPAYRKGLYVGLYRGSIVKISGAYSVYYSYIRSDRYQGMVLAQSNDIYRLLPYNSDISSESETILIDEDNIIPELYVHSAKYIHIKDCNVTIDSFTGMKPNSIIDVVVTGSGSLKLTQGDRIDKPVDINAGGIKLLAVSSRNVLVI